MKDRPGVNMLREYKMIADNYSRSCGACGFLGVFGAPSLTGALCCYNFRGFQHSTAEGCEDHRSIYTLRGKIERWKRARERLTLAIKIHTGENVGTVNDPRHPSPPAQRKKRK